MKVLVACEFSGRVRDAFIARGHDAVSVDLIPSDAPGPHITGDALAHIAPGYDLLIAFPPCTYLCAAGCRYWYHRAAEQSAAVRFVRALWAAPIQRIAVENPVGYLSTVFAPPTQYIQPYEHGDPYTKKTCLWLKSLPPLSPSRIVVPGSSYVMTRRNDGNRAKERSKTFQGIAEAMAEQWGNL